MVDDFPAWVIAAFPELVAQYASLAGDLASEWYDEAAPTLAFQATPAPLPPMEKWAATASWAMHVGDAASSLGLLAGSAQRGVFNQYRTTIIANANAEGAAWARHASANACPFCRMLATRGAVYASESSATRVGGRGKVATPNQPARRGRKAGGIRVRGTQALGDKYHDNCHCIAVEVRPGGAYQPPPYVSQWQDEYKRASAAAGNGKGAGSTQDIQRIMREGV